MGRVFESLQSHQSHIWDKLTAYLFFYAHFSPLREFPVKIRILKKPMLNASASVVLYGGDEGDRTPDLLNAIQALSQLSYAPVQYV